MLKLSPEEITHDILFVDVGANQESYFTWVNPQGGTQFSKTGIMTARSFPGDVSQYVHLRRVEYKLLFRIVPHPEKQFPKIFLIVGASTSCQNQVMEAFFDYLGERWFDRFHDFTGDACSSNACASFGEDVQVAFREVLNNRIKTVQVFCRACNQPVDIHVKTNIINHATSFPISVAFLHANHALLLFIDRDYHSRGEQIITVTE